MIYPSFINIGNLAAEIRENERKVPPGMAWVPARRAGTSSIGNRFRAAWMVFTGRADVLIWPDEGRRK